ncbi:TBC1 domain family member 31 [Frankliniella fusca]|uniref:TBC1 domain family member 31 n=1 Tax=Frankliniella fusca TaxID=407009 RepID=A0AAE1HP64_9NEOP|nr:TBC1 domain family member 31 [Frankliniella fusca]
MTTVCNLETPIFKQPYEKKINREDGLLLKVHHTAPGPSGDIRRTRFLLASFSSCDDLLALADHRGNLFIVDLANCMFWSLGKYLSITLLAFNPHKKAELFVSTEEQGLQLLNVETGHQLGTLSGHSESPTQVSFNSGGKFCLSVASCEGFIWDLKTLTQAHRLNLQHGMTIKQALFMPVSDNILACFQDDAIHIWAFQSFQCVKQIVPDSWNGHSIRSIAFTRNGRAMVLGGVSKHLVVFTVDDWDAQVVVKLPDYVSGVAHLEFLPQAFDSGANQILLVLTDSGLILLADIAKTDVMKSMTENNIRSFTCSLSGKYLVCNTTYGEAKIFSGTHFLKNAINSANNMSSVPVRKENPSELACNPQENTQTKGALLNKQPKAKKKVYKVNQQIEKLLDISRLRPILKEYLVYPEQYRCLIWRSLLQLPGNKGPWKSLAEKPLHATAQALSETNPIQNKVVLSCLQSVVSCLAHWSPVFGEIPYLSHFLFPFVKVFHSDRFVCFEVAATIIFNWCQHWFEYLTFPPINILGMVENILVEHDLGLINIFSHAGITTRQYAWTLLSTAFSEVLSSTQWMQLWDHIISNPPEFLLFAVVAYNICCRASFKTCSTKKDFEFFFRNQNPIDMKYFLKKSYELMETTSEQYHPKQYFKPFSPLTKGNYPVFSEFPKFIVNYQKEQRDSIRQEEENILQEQHLVISQKLAREELLAREREARIHETRLLGLVTLSCLNKAEKAANTALKAEESRLLQKRQQLAAFRRDLRAQEEEALAAARVETMELQLKQRTAELERLHHQLFEKAQQSGIDKEGLNEEMHEQFSKLNAKKQEMKQRLEDYKLRQLAKPIIENIVSCDEIQNLKHQQKLLREEIQKLRKESSNQGLKAVDIDMKMTELDILQQKIEVALAKKALLDQDTWLSAEHSIQEAHSKAKLKKLENEVEELSHKLSSIKNLGNPHIRCKSLEAERKLLDVNEPVICFESSQQVSSVPFRGSDLYQKEKCAVSSAMDLRRSLLSGWNTSQP